MGLCGAIVVPPACVPCQEREKGRKFSYLLHVLCACPLLVLSCPSLEERQQTTRHKKRNGLLYGRFLLGCGMSFLLWSWIRLIVSKHCQRFFRLGKNPYLFGRVVAFHPSGSRACNIPKVCTVVRFGFGIAPKYGRCFHCVCHPVVCCCLFLPVVSLLKRCSNTFQPWPLLCLQDWRKFCGCRPSLLGLLFLRG